MGKDDEKENVKPPKEPDPPPTRLIKDSTEVKDKEKRKKINS